MPWAYTITIGVNGLPEYKTLIVTLDLIDKLLSIANPNHVAPHVPLYVSLSPKYPSQSTLLR